MNSMRSEKKSDQSSKDKAAAAARNQLFVTSTSGSARGDQVM